MRPEVKAIKKIIRHNTTIIRQIRREPTLTQRVTLKEKLMEGFKLFKQSVS